MRNKSKVQSLFTLYIAQLGYFVSVLISLTWNNENQWGLVSKASNYILCSYSFYNFKWEDYNWISLETKDSGIPWGLHSSSSWSCEFAALTNRNLLLCALQFIYHTLLIIDNGLQTFCDAPSHKAVVWLQNNWNTVHNFFYDTFLIFDPFLRIGHFHRHPIHFYCIDSVVRIFFKNHLMCLLIKEADMIK